VYIGDRVHVSSGVTTSNSSITAFVEILDGLYYSSLPYSNSFFSNHFLISNSESMAIKDETYLASLKTEEIMVP